MQVYSEVDLSELNTATEYFTEWELFMKYDFYCHNDELYFNLPYNNPVVKV